MIVAGPTPVTVFARGLGPSLAADGVTTPLADPLLELRSSDQKLVASNDDWQSPDGAAVLATGAAPSDPGESAFVASLPAGGDGVAYTALVRAKDGGTGVAALDLVDLR